MPAASPITEMLADMLERLAAELDEEAQVSEDKGGYTEPQVYRWAAQHVRDRAADLIEEYEVWNARRIPG